VVAEMLDRGMASEEIIAVLKVMGLESPPEPEPGQKTATAAERRREFLSRRLNEPIA